jgi:quercetin dioxygenase-like cupin family protein
VIIKWDSEVREMSLKEEGIKDVTRQILIGPEDGSLNIIMRRFRVLPGGNTPFHCHGFEHVIKITRGRGVIVNESGQEMAVSEGQSAFIEAHEKHQFKNPNDRPFEFLCVILNPERSR